MSILAPTVAAPFEKFKEKTRFRIGTWSVRRHFALMALSALLFVVMHAVFTPTRVAQGDSQQYLALAQTLTDHNVFAYSKEEARPGALAGRNLFIQHCWRPCRVLKPRCTRLLTFARCLWAPAAKTRPRYFPL